MPHPVKGESIYAYVTVLDEVQPSAKLHAELVNLVKNQIGSFAAPDVIHWAPGERGGAVGCCFCKGGHRGCAGFLMGRGFVGSLVLLLLWVARWRRLVYKV